MAKAVAMAFDITGWDVVTPGRDQLDVTRPEAVNAYFKDRPVDLLVCAAGVTLDAPLARYTSEMWDQVMATNFQGAADCVDAVLPGMIGRQKGHVLLISSYSALHPPSGQIAYATAKAALLGLTTSLARQHGANGIRINAVLPGFMDTPMTSAVTAGRRTEVLTSHVLGCLNTPQAVGKFIRFLEEELPFTSGQIFQLDSRIS